MASYKFDDVYFKIVNICRIELRKSWLGIIRVCDCDDVIQEASIKVLNNIKNYNSKRGSFDTFLNRIIRSVILDWVRAEKRDRRVINSKTILFSEIEGQGGDGDFIDLMPDVDGNYIDLIESVATASLTANEKVYVSLSIQGYTQRDISSKMEVSAQYVSKLKKSVKKKFKEFELVG